MDIVVNEELKAYIDPLSEDEYAALERSILDEGCRDALVLWGDVLVDGHNRYGICRKHGLPFQTVQNTRFQSMEDVYLWMIDQHLGRRSVSDFQRGVLALRKRELLQERRHQQRAQQLSGPDHLDDAVGTAGEGAESLPWESAADDAPVPPAAMSSIASAEPLEPGSDADRLRREAEAFNSREALARAARLSSSQVSMIEKIQKQAAPELVAAVRAGSISLSAAATLTALPEDEQKAAAEAGPQELKLAAKRIRDAKRKPRAERPDEDAAASAEDVRMLRQRVTELTEENEGLKLQLAELRAQLG